MLNDDRDPSLVRINLLRVHDLSASAAAPSASPSAASSEPQLEFDHVWIVVTRDAPERAALERAGLKISPDVNRHDGQGTASISASF